jgi:apolipoprotein N-acyltransferase
VLTRPQITLSLALFLAAIVAIAAALGDLWMGVGIALFALALVAIDAKPSWKRIFNTARTGGDRDGVFARAWHRTAGWNSRDDDPAR